MKPGELQVTAPSGREVRISRGFAAPPDLVFACYTRSALVRRWLLGPEGWTMPVCEIDLRRGGTYRYVWRHPEHGEMSMRGTYLEVRESKRLVSTQIFGENRTSGESIVTTEFEFAEGLTTVVTTVLYPTPAARDAALKTGMTDGMGSGYRRLDALLAAELA